MTDNTSQQALRTKPVPEKLGELIELVNLIPADESFPSLTEAWEEFWEERLWEKPETDPHQEIVNVYKKSIQNLPNEIQEFIGPINSHTLTKVDERYSYIYDGRNLLRIIAQIDKATSKVPLNYSQQKLTQLRIDESGQITFQRSPLLDALEGVEAGRIRQCQICQKIFWAGRIDQPACSKKCGQTLRVRRWRGNYPEKYKRQRVLKEPSITGMRSKKGRN